MRYNGNLGGVGGRDPPKHLDGRSGSGAVEEFGDPLHAALQVLGVLTYENRTWRSGRFDPKSIPGVSATPACLAAFAQTRDCRR